MGDPIGMLCVGSMCVPFRCCSTSETWCLAWSLPISVMAALIAAAHWVTDGAGGLVCEIHGNAPNTRSVGMSPLGPVVSLTAFTAICSLISFVVMCSPSSSVMILYAHLSSPWYRSIKLTDCGALTGTHFVQIAIDPVLCRNLVLSKLVPAS